MILRPAVKIPAFLFLVLAALALGVGAVLWLMNASLPDVRFLAKTRASLEITVRDWDGKGKPFLVGPENPAWTPLSEIPLHLRRAVLAAEDFSFYGHKGVDWFEVKESFRKNLETRRFARGASTITQQLAKNLFLSREKSLTRKLREVLLARKLEKALKKDRILELYLNIVELGNMVYGVGQGSRYHFGKPPAALSLRESTILAAMLPGPKVYDPARRPDRVMNRSDHILGIMLKGRMISEDGYLEALNQFPFSDEPEPSPDLPSGYTLEADWGGAAAAQTLSGSPEGFIGPAGPEPEEIPIPRHDPGQEGPGDVPVNEPPLPSPGLSSQAGTG